MKVFYRVSPYLSSNPNPFSDDKKEIVYRCFNSFKKALTNQEVMVISDGIPSDWYNLFKGHRVVQGRNGNVETFHQQVDLICKLDNEEKVMFVEDDYLWKEGAIKTIEDALDEFTLLSPYDHPGHYTEPRFIHQPKEMYLHNNQVYRKAPSNTLTFATYAWVIQQNKQLIKGFGVRDHDMFTALKMDMFVPVPALATHLVKGLLSTGSDWEKEWDSSTYL